MFMSLKNDLTSAKSVDPDEMPFYVTFHLGLHFLPKYPFRGFQSTKGYGNQTSLCKREMSLHCVYKVSDTNS